MGNRSCILEVCIMCSLELTKIDLKGMKEEANRLDFDLTDDFFQALDGSQLEHGTLHVSVSIRKMAGFFEIQFHTEGHVTVTCDRCLDDMEQPIETDNRLLVRLGDTYSEDDDTVTIVPIKHVHAPGKCNSAMTQKLEELSGAVRSGEEEAEAVDPRWKALSELKSKM